MKILMLAYKFPPVHLSGLELGTDYMSRHLAARGHDVHVVVTRRDPGQPFRDRRHGVQIWRLPVLGIPYLRSIWELLAASVLILWLRPTVLHGQALFPCGWLAAFWGRLLGVRSLVYLYGRDVAHPSQLLREVLGSQALRWADVVLAATSHCQEAALRIAPREIQIFLSGFETPLSWPAVDRESNLILFVGRLEEVKGVDILLQALTGLASSWRLRVIGEGSCRVALREQALQLGLAERVEWCGRVENDQIHGEMARAAILVLPSREEPYGIVLLEALANGCQIVASAVGGIPEIVGTAGSGWLVKPENPEALKLALQTALEASAPGSNLLDKIRQEFSWQSRVEKLEAYYRVSA